MSRMNWNKISNWLFYLGILIGAFGYYKIYKIQAVLPPGVCPVNDNRWILFVGITFLVASVITALIYERKTNNKAIEGDQ